MLIFAVVTITQAHGIKSLRTHLRFMTACFLVTFELTFYLLLYSLIVARAWDSPAASGLGTGSQSRPVKTFVVFLL